MTPEEQLKQAIEEQKKAFEEFKKANDERLKLVETKGSAPADFETKLAKINEVLDASEKKQKKAFDEIEKKVNRLELGGAGTETEAKKAIEKKAAFLDAIRYGMTSEKLTPERKALLISGDSTGAVLSPAEYLAEIIKAEVLYSPVRSVCRSYMMGAGELQIPKRTGTAAATRVGESSTRGETQNPSWGLLKIPAPEMYAEARISQQNLEDSAFDLEALLRDEFSEQFGVKEGAEVITGNGVGQMLGILDANAGGPGVPIAYTPSGSAATIAGAAGAQGDGIIDLFHAIKTAYAAFGTWALSRGSLGKVRKLKDTQGRYLWEPSPVVGNPGSILGRPYVEFPDMSDEGANTFPIAFGDWRRAFLIVDRVDMQVIRDPLTLLGVGQVKIVARRRVGGQVVLGEALRLLKCATS